MLIKVLDVGRSRHGRAYRGGDAIIEPPRDLGLFSQVLLEADAPAGLTSAQNRFDLAPWALQAELKVAGALSPSGEAA